MALFISFQFGSYTLVSGPFWLAGRVCRPASALVVVAVTFVCSLVACYSFLDQILLLSSAAITSASQPANNNNSNLTIGARPHVAPPSPCIFAYLTFVFANPASLVLLRWPTLCKACIGRLAGPSKGSPSAPDAARQCNFSSTALASCRRGRRRPGCWRSRRGSLCVWLRPKRHAPLDSIYDQCPAWI